MVNTWSVSHMPWISAQPAGALLRGRSRRLSAVSPRSGGGCGLGEVRHANLWVTQSSKGEKPGLCLPDQEEDVVGGGRSHQPVGDQV